MGATVSDSRRVSIVPYGEALGEAYSLRESYRLCARVTRQSSSNFYYSFLLLPREKRQSMCALYAFARHTDDLSDGPEAADVSRTALTAWRQSLARALAGRFDDPLLPALADTVHRFQIPQSYLEDIVAGVEMDLVHDGYETFADLERYCYHVASVVGLACIHVWGFTDPRALEPARRCGLAFQLTNILRDLKEDIGRGRIYLPREDLRQFGYAPEELERGVYDERFRRLMRFEIERTEQFYADAAELHQYLFPDGQPIFRAMVATYRALLDEIKRSDGDVWSRRIRLPAWRKAQIAARCLFSLARPGAAEK